MNQRPSPAPPTSEFEASSSGSSTSLVWLAVNEDGVSLLDQHSMQLLARYSYDNVVTFGGCQDDFMLVVTSESASSLHSLDGSGQPQTQQPNVNKPTHRGNHSDRASSEDSLGTTKLLFNAGKPQVCTVSNKNFSFIGCVLKLTLLFQHSVRLYGGNCVGGVHSHFKFLQLHHKMSLIIVAWYVLRVKNMYSLSLSDTLAS